MRILSSITMHCRPSQVTRGQLALCGDMSCEVCNMQTMETQPGLRNFRLNSEAHVCSRFRDTRRFNGNPPDGVTMHLYICPTKKINVRTTNTAGFLKTFQVAIRYIRVWFSTTDYVIQELLQRCVVYMPYAC